MTPRRNNTRGGRPVAVGVAAAIAGFPSAARAHLVQTGFGPFYDGIAHVFLTPVDVIVIVGIGLWAGLAGRSSARRILVLAPLCWLAGGVVGAHFGMPAAAEWLTTASVIVIGLLVAAEVRGPRWLAAAVAGLLAAWHGFATGATAVPGGADLRVVSGSALVVFMLVSVVPAVVVSLRAGWPRIAVRVAGSWMAAIGLLMIGWIFRSRGG